MLETTKWNKHLAKKEKSSHVPFPLEEYLIPGEIYGAYYPGNMFLTNGEEFFAHEAFKTISINNLKNLKIDDLMLVLNVETLPPEETSSNGHFKVTVLSLSLGKTIFFHWPKGKSPKSELKERFPPLNIISKAKALQDLERCAKIGT